MSARPRVLVDCDGVLADFMSSALEIINATLGTAHELSAITQCSFADALDLRASEAAAVKRAIGASPRLADRLPVYSGAIEGMRKLREVAEVYIVTSSWDSNETWEYDRKAWLKRHFDIHHHEIVFTAAKHLVYGDMLVDDKTSTVAAWRQAFPWGLAVQWVTPHNRLDAWDGHFTDSWDELVALIARRK